MATTYLPGALRPANPTRRAFISAAGLAVPIAATAASPVLSNPRQKWASLVAEFHRKEAALQVVAKEHNAAETAFFAGRELLGECPKAPEADYPRPIDEMTVGELRELRASPEKQKQFATAFADWHAECEKLEQHTVAEVEDRWQTATDEREDAVNAIFACPSPDAAALLFKLNLAEREYHGLGIDLDETVAKHVFTDVRRFARGEA